MLKYYFIDVALKTNEMSIDDQVFNRTSVNYMTNKSNE